MEYALTPADAAPAPAGYASEARYLGYRDADRARPYAAFFAETVAPVQPHVLEAAALGESPAELGYPIDEAARRLSRPGYEPVETGRLHLPDGTVVVAVLTRMPGVSAAMWDWWFGWHSRETARYKLWHPAAHFYSALAEDRAGDRGLTDRERYVGNVSFVDEYIGARANRLAIRFVAPTRIGFAEQGPDETVIVARVGPSDVPVASGWLVHQIRPTSDGCEMRSRFFLGGADLLPVPAHALTGGPGRLLTSPLGRVAGPVVNRVAKATAGRMGADLLLHCAQEMNHLAGFLPALHEAFAGSP